MGTTFKSIYSMFLSKIDDPTFAEMTDEDALEVMHGALITAIASVREFRDGGYALNSDKSAFLYNLSDSEKEVLALGMVEVWETAQANSISLTKHFISSKEEVFCAQHNHLNGLLNLAGTTRHGKERIRSRYKTLHNDYLGTEEELEADIEESEEENTETEPSGEEENPTEEDNTSTEESGGEGNDQSGIIDTDNTEPENPEG